MTTLFWISYSALWLSVALLAGLVFLMYRYAGSVAMSPRNRRDEQGPALGSRVTLIRVTDQGGAELPIGRSRGLTQLVCFVSPNCPGCEAALANIIAVVNDRRGAVQAIVICAAEAGVFAAKYPHLSGLVQLVGDPKMELAEVWGISSTPWSVLVAPDGTVMARGAPVDRGTWLEFIQSAETPKPSHEGQMSIA